MYVLYLSTYPFILSPSTTPRPPSRPPPPRAACSPALHGNTAKKMDASSSIELVVPSAVTSSFDHVAKTETEDPSKFDRGVMAAGKNPWKFLTLSYLNQMMMLSVKRPLEAEDLPLLKPADRANALAECLEPFNAQVSEYLKKMKIAPGASAPKLKPPSLIPPIFKSYGHYFYFSLIFQVLSVAANLYTPQVLQALIVYLQGGQPQNVPAGSTGITLSFLLFAVSVVRIGADLTHLQLVRNFQFNALGVAKVAVFEKFLKLGNKGTKEFNEGRIISMVNVDAEQFANALLVISDVITLPPQIILTLYFLIRLIGSSLIPAIVVMILCIIIMVPLGTYISKYQKAYMTAEDGRVKSLREVLMGMKIIKVRAEEEYREKIVDGKRETQLDAIKGSLMVISIMLTLLPHSFSTRKNNGGVINPAIIFPALIYFGNLLQPLQGLPSSISMLITGLVALTRIQTYLVAEEREPASILSDDDEHDIVIENATFKWEEAPPAPAKKVKKPKDNKKAAEKQEENEDEEKEEEGKNKEKNDEPLIKDLNLKIRKGKLTAIVGVVGSGKSSLLSAILGEMTCISGKTSIPLLATSLNVCGLDRDLSSLPRGLNTQIGEKGIILSGGQRARVALARAVYDEADVYLLDDPISALDAEVGKWVFEECVKGKLEGTTRVLVTHQLHVLEKCDWVVVMDEGRVVEEGTFDDLMKKEEGERSLRAMMKDYQSVTEKDTDADASSSESSTSTATDATATSPNLKSAPKSDKVLDLIAEEDRQRGGLKFSVIKGYWSRAGGAPIVTLLVFVMVFLITTQTLRDLWLAWWSDGKFGLSTDVYFSGYAVLGIGNVVMMLSLAFVLATSSYFASKKLHKDAMTGLMKAPMSFFDSQPIGRILNRMSKDIEGIDKMLWMVYLNFLYIGSAIISGIVSLAYTTPYVLILFAHPPCEADCVSGEVRPLNAHISECLSGVTSLRAFKAEHRMAMTLRDLLDRSNGPNMAQMTIRIWLNIRIQFFSSIIILFVSLFGVLTTTFAASLLGLAISTATSLTEQLSYFVMFTANLEAEMVAVERIREYSRNLPREAPRDLPADPAPDHWPKGGAIEVKNLSVKYASGAEPVIKNLTLSIGAGEKVGIVGRTGSGKSTFLTALFRIVEPHDYPQEPVLFTGTIRTNIDPETIHGDAAIWDALDMVGLKDYVSTRDGKLDSSIEENGGNLSVGQRQLLILARALIARPKILVMDEASSSVDGAADTLIQASIKSHFGDATVISIAHRLNTVADFDRVVVLEDGMLVEFDTPANLLRLAEGAFKRLVDATGAKNAALILKVAEEHEERVKGNA
ncbi:P-loop containing nucleoside triphosphate hydrolase protein [Chytridium lagenaria]|nr:P-loop containing nucleoside triphosphate hydrolase protein [Chytridium lagenaria]